MENEAFEIFRQKKTLDTFYLTSLENSANKTVGACCALLTKKKD